MIRKPLFFLSGLLFSLLLGLASRTFAQVKVGDNPGTIDASAALEVESTNKGFLPPRVSLTSLTAASPMTSPATGLVVYNTNATLGTGIYVNTGTPAAPIWAQINVSTATQGGSFNKLIYRGAVDPTRTITAGIFEFRIRGDATQSYVDARLLSAPTSTIVATGPRLGWSSTNTGTTQANATFTTANWNTFQQLDFIGNNAGLLLYLNITGQEKFYRISLYTVVGQYYSLLVEVF